MLGSPASYNPEPVKSKVECSCEPTCLRVVKQYNASIIYTEEGYIVKILCGDATDPYSVEKTCPRHWRITRCKSNN